MITYFKQGLRLYFKIDGDIVTRVINKEKHSVAEIMEDPTGLLKPDEYTLKECSEEEFNREFSIAKDRIFVGKIL